MSSLFSMDNPVFRFMGHVADLMILNIVFLITCIPIITIGPALTGMHYVTLKMAEEEEGYIIRGYLKSFRENFKQGLIISILMALVALVLVCDINITNQMDGSLINVLQVMIYAMAVVYIMVFIYVFPTLARFANTTKNTIRNAFIMAVADFPRTILMVATTAGAVVVTFLNGYTFWYGLLVWLMVGFAALARVNSTFLVQVFGKYTPEEEADADPDHWDVEASMADAPKADETEAITIDTP